MVKTEFGLFPHSLFRPNVRFLEGALPPGVKDPWARREAWRSNPVYSMRNRVRTLFSGVGLGLAAFGLYVAYDQWYMNMGPGAAEAKYWKNWAEERNKRLGHDDHSHH